jgi:hypothetical protein
MDYNDLNHALKYGTELPTNKHNAGEVKPAYYAVVKSGIMTRSPDRLVSKHKTLADAYDANFVDQSHKAGHHLYAVYPDKSMKLLSPSGGETPFYHIRLNGGSVEHTPTTHHSAPNYVPPHQADAAPLSMHRHIELALVHAAWTGLGREDVRSKVDTSKGSQAHGLVRQAMETGDLTPILILADHLQEQGLESVPNQLRNTVDKFKDNVDDLRWHRLLRT